MVHTRFDGDNLRQIMEESDFSVIYSYIDEDLSGIPTEKVMQEIGQGEYLLVSSSENIISSADEKMSMW